MNNLTAPVNFTNGLGAIVPSGDTTEERLHKCGLDWEPREETLITASSFSVPSKHKAIVGPEGVLGVVSDSYKIIPNAALISLAAQLEDEAGATVDRLSIFGGGQQVLIQLKADTKYGFDNDPTMGHYSILANHDGKGSVQLFPHVTRLACTNSFHPAIEMAADRHMMVRHTGDVDFKILELQLAIQAMDNSMATYQKQVERMADTYLAEGDRKVLAYDLADIKLTRPESVEDHEGFEKYRRALDRNAERILSSPSHGARPGTKYDIWNRVTHFYQHQRGGDGTRAKRALLPTSTDSRHRQEALDMILAY